MSAEKDVLLRTLASQRSHILECLEGLDDAALHRSVLPSGWTPIGLVQHLALDVERFWFRAVVAGEQVDLPSGAQGWQVDAATPASAVLDLYRDECARADAVIAAHDLDAQPGWWPSDLFEGMTPMSLRSTVLHVITETACHTGHLDVVRELVDGHQRLVLTD